MKTFDTILRNDKTHRVADAFPVRLLFAFSGKALTGCDC
jgi:hypothetical protein